MSFEIALTRRQEILIAVALAAVPLIAVALFAGYLCAGWSAHYASIDALARQRDAYRHAIAGMPALQADLAALRREQAAGRYFFRAAEGSEAAAKLRSDIGGLIGKDGATIQRDEVELVAYGDDAPVVLRASLSLTGDIKALTRVLYHLRQARPLLFVTQLAVHSAADVPALAAPNTLQADLVVQAYMAAP
jgi:hypothetical protein